MSAKRWPCVLRDPLIRSDVNPRINRAWEAYHGDTDPPFAAFQRIWRTEHCAEINPYGSEDCPYRARDCLIAYYKTAIDAIEEPGVRSVVGLFRTMAHRRGLERADTKPLARERMRTDGQGPSRSATGDRDLSTGPDVHRGSMVSIASLFGQTDPRSLLASPGRGEGQEGTKRQVPPRDDV